MASRLTELRAQHEAQRTKIKHMLEENTGSWKGKPELQSAYDAAVVELEDIASQLAREQQAIEAGVLTGENSQAVEAALRGAHASGATPQQTDSMIERLLAALNGEGGIQVSGGARRMSPIQAAIRQRQPDVSMFDAWVRNGNDGMREFTAQVAAAGNELQAAEVRKLFATMSTTTPSQGGYTVPSMIASFLYDAMKAYGAMRATANIITTADGRPLSYPTSDGRAEVGEIVAQNATATGADVSFGTAALNVYRYSSKIVAVPWELIQDATIDIEALVRKRLAQRLGRIGNQHFTTGTGTGQPQGVVPVATVGKTGLTGQTTTIIFDDVVDVIHSVDPAYRTRDVTWQTSDAILKVLRKLKDTANRPIWAPSFEAGITRGIGMSAGFTDQQTPVPFDQLLGYPMYVNNDMPAPGANNKSLMFGDMDFYVIRDAMDVLMFRFTDSVYSTLGQVGFLCFCRMGGNLMDANAISVYQHSAT